MVELSGVRTADLLNAIQALYQLSYSPEVFGFAAKAWEGPLARRRTLGDTPPPINPRPKLFFASAKP